MTSQASTCSELDGLMSNLDLSGREPSFGTKLRGLGADNLGPRDLGALRGLGREIARRDGARDYEMARAGARDVEIARDHEMASSDSDLSADEVLVVVVVVVGGGELVVAVESGSTRCCE